MRYLLDTQAWLWSVLDHPRLSRRARAALIGVSAEEPAGIAAISLKEAAWHLARGHIAIDEDFGPWPLWLRAAAASPHVEGLPLTVDVAIESEQLGGGFPPDPADRLIAATARVHDLTLVTSTGPFGRAAPYARCGNRSSSVFGRPSPVLAHVSRPVCCRTVRPPLVVCRTALRHPRTLDWTGVWSPEAED